jgi:hypothetical protein
MKKIIPFFVCLFLTLALTELFFRANAKFYWVPDKNTKIELSSNDALNISTHSEDLDTSQYSTINKSPHKSELNQDDYKRLSAWGRRLFKKVEPPVNLIEKIRYHDYDNKELKLNVSLKSENDLIFEKIYSFDTLNRRKTPLANTSLIKKNLLLLGCSYSFGEGVGDDETIANHLARRLPNVNVYNFGISKGGLTNILDDIVYGERLKDISKMGGVVVYQFFYDHLRRHFTYLNYLDKNKDRQQYFYSLENQKLIFNDRNSFEVKFKAALYKILNFSYTLKFSGILDDTASVENQIDFVNLLTYVSDFYKKTYGLEFYIFIMSERDVPSELFIQQLQAKNVKFILYPGIQKHFAGHQVKIPADKHYNNFGNFIFAEFLHTALQRRELLGIKNKR